MRSEMGADEFQRFCLTRAAARPPPHGRTR
jgi:hypothetical protein